MKEQGMEIDDRHKLVGRIVRDEITNTGSSYSDAARTWPISLPTLNRLMNTGVVGIRFYRLAEVNLRLPRGLFDAVIDGDTQRITGMTELNPQLRDFILVGLGAKPATAARRRKAN